MLAGFLRGGLAFLCPPEDFVDHFGFCVGVILEVFPIFCGVLALGAEIEVAIFGIGAEMIAEEKDAIDFAAAAREDVEIHVGVRSFEDAVVLLRAGVLAEN